MRGTTANIKKRSNKFSFVLKCVKTSRHDREVLIVTSHGLPYIISNLTMWTITTLKGFRIGACIKEISMGDKLTLGLIHPVVKHFKSVIEHTEDFRDLCAI